jgi:hypothetical protein
MQRPCVSRGTAVAAQGTRDAPGDVILHRKDVVELPVETVRPSVVAGCHLNELHRHTQAIAGLANAALEQGLDVELFANAPDILALAAELKGRRTRGHAQTVDLRQRVDQLLGQPVTEELLVVRRTHVRERQHGNRGDRRVRPRHRGRRRGRLSRHRRDESIAPPVASLDELRPFGIVAEDAAQFLNARRQRIVGHRDVRPDGRKQLAFRHRRTGMGHEDLEDVRGLGGQAHVLPAEPELAGVELKAVFTEADALRHGSQYISSPARIGGLMRSPAASPPVTSPSRALRAGRARSSGPS